jgi:3-hydroxyisobutyrate dehydrogenase-like beta-hydroxyacid dehydrogenase
MKMFKPTVAVLHPGSMGAAVARELAANTEGVLWLPPGRSAATAERAIAAGLTAVDNPEELFERADVIVSVCPPGPAADGVADLALKHEFRGIFVDANAISPMRVTRMATRLVAAGMDVVDASIIGAPPSATSTTSVYLSGEARSVKVVADLLAGTHCVAKDLDRPIGAASALKLAYASYTKTTTVLAGLAHALAAHHGLQSELLAEATETVAGTPLAEPNQIIGGAGKAWRWTPEFAEMADAFEDADLPAEVSQAATLILRHWTDLKDDSGAGIEQVLDHLRPVRAD